MKNTDEIGVTRRGALVKLGGVAATVLGAGAWSAKELLDVPEAEAAGTGPAAVASGLVTCVLSPEMTEGPYYVEGDKVRRNITEGKPGVLLSLRLSVVDVSSCKAIKGAAVDIWHCDAGGVYSATSVRDTEERTFLRGIQKTDKNGLAIFRTVYPGRIRAARSTSTSRSTSAGARFTRPAVLPDFLTDTVYRRSPYNRRSARDVRNASDSIFRNGGSKSMLKLVRSGSGYVGRITMGVARS